jgi:hypothetical protein
MILGGKGLEYWQHRRFGLPGSGGSDNQKIEPGFDACDGGLLHFIEMLNSGRREQGFNRHPPLLRLA